MGVSHFFEEKIINVAEVNSQHWLEESGQWLDFVDRTHLVLASGRPVVRKKINVQVLFTRKRGQELLRLL